MEFRYPHVSYDCFSTLERTAHKSRVALSVAHANFIRSEIDDLGSGTKIPSDIECTRVLPRFSMPLDQAEHQRCLKSSVPTRTLRECGLQNRTERRSARPNSVGYETVPKKDDHTTKATQMNGKDTPLLKSVSPTQHGINSSLILQSQSYQS